GSRRRCPGRDRGAQSDALCAGRPFDGWQGRPAAGLAPAQGPCRPRPCRALATAASAMPPENREIMANAYSTRETVIMAVEQMMTAKALSPKHLEEVIEDSLRGAPQAKAAWPRSTSLEDITREVTAISVPIVVIAGEL